jgi:enamine deaminase RidA (YjgF/YER057c/UK114 family)
MSVIEQRLIEIGTPLPQAPKPLANYVPAVRTGNYVFTSGQVPSRDGALQCRGGVGEKVTLEEAAAAAGLAALNALAAIKTVIGDLDAVTQVVRLTGYVNSAADFTDQPAVINGASDFLVEVFGDKGRHSRAAVGVYQLPLGASVEIDLIVEVNS